MTDISTAYHAAKRAEADFEMARARADVTRWCPGAMDIPEVRAARDVKHAPDRVLHEAFAATWPTRKGD